MKEANREVLDRGSLPELLALRARQASDRRLVLDAALGLLGGAAVVVLRPPLWMPLAALAWSLAMFGLWGILDREASDQATPASRARILGWARVVIAMLGALGAAFFGVTLFFALLGRIIS